jgi:hypothetical protein
VLSKLRAITSRRFALDLPGATPSTLDIGDVLDGGILIARLPKGILGEDTTRLMGSLLLTGLWQAATARTRQPEAQRLDAAVYVDECDNFLHLPIGLDDALAESRSYRLSWTLTHQHLGQLSKTRADANARNDTYFAHPTGRAPPGPAHQPPPDRRRPQPSSRLPDRLPPDVRRPTRTPLHPPDPATTTLDPWLASTSPAGSGSSRPLGRRTTRALRELPTRSHDLTPAPDPVGATTPARVGPPIHPPIPSPTHPPAGTGR